MSAQELQAMVDSISFPNNTIKLGSRKSKLAVVQAEIVADHIKRCFPHLKSKIISLTTLGDQVQNKPLYSFGGKSLWTRELEILLLEPIGDYERIDLIVHSLKDMPTCLPNEFELGCIMKREGEFLFPRRRKRSRLRMNFWPFFKADWFFRDWLVFPPFLFPISAITNY